MDDQTKAIYLAQAQRVAAGKPLLSEAPKHVPVLAEDLIALLGDLEDADNAVLLLTGAGARETFGAHPTSVQSTLRVALALAHQLHDVARRTTPHVIEQLEHALQLADRQDAR
jgi:hypothetical protein